jgi:hypothetical protein
LNRENLFQPVEHKTERILSMALELGKAYQIKNVAYNTVLNLYGNHSGTTITAGNAVTLYPSTGDLDQKWKILAYANAAKVCSLRNESYILNYNTTDASCIVWPLSTASVTDSEIDFMTIDRDNNLYRIKLCQRNLYLTATGSSEKLYWEEGTGDNDQLFQLIAEEETETPTESDSALVTKFIPADSSNYTENRTEEGGTISEITIHHCAGIMSIDDLGTLWQNPTRNGSSHYGVSDTSIGQYVREKDVAWTNGNWEANCRAVTIETSNNGGAPEWPVSDTTFETLVQLVADIAKRNQLGKLVKGNNLTWHSMYSATACPGPYLTERLQAIVDQANAINGY